MTCSDLIRKSGYQECSSNNNISGPFYSHGLTKYGVTMNKWMPTSDIIFCWQNLTKHKASVLELVHFLMRGMCLCGYKHSSTSVVLCILFQNVSKHLSMLAMLLLACGSVKIHKKLGVHFNVKASSHVSSGPVIKKMVSWLSYLIMGILIPDKMVFILHQTQDYDEAVENKKHVWKPHLWASYQIRKIAGCACVGNAGNVFPTTVG